MTNAAPQYVLQSWPTARQWDRAQITAPVTVQVGTTLYHGWGHDICSGGLGFVCAAPLALGDEISVTVTIDKLGKVQARGIVRHSAAFRSGCEFIFISPAEQQSIERYVRSSRATTTRR